MKLTFEMKDWCYSEGLDDCSNETWQATLEQMIDRVYLEIKGPNGTARTVWLELDNGDLMVHAYDSENDEPSNLRIKHNMVIYEGPLC